MKLKVKYSQLKLSQNIDFPAKNHVNGHLHIKKDLILSKCAKNRNRIINSTLHTTNLFKYSQMSAQVYIYNTKYEFIHKEIILTTENVEYFTSATVKKYKYRRIIVLQNRLLSRS